jgi:hypothetical protein
VYPPTPHFPPVHLQGIQAGALQAPARAKGFDPMAVLNLVAPGMRETVGQLSAVGQVVGSITDMWAVFLVTYAVLQAAGARVAAPPS